MAAIAATVGHSVAGGQDRVRTMPSAPYEATAQTTEPRCLLVVTR
jgi:hypothetical protein